MGERTRTWQYWMATRRLWIIFLYHASNSTTKFIFTSVLTERLHFSIKQSIFFQIITWNYTMEDDKFSSTAFIDCLNTIYTQTRTILFLFHWQTVHCSGMSVVSRHWTQLPMCLTDCLNTAMCTASFRVTDHGWLPRYISTWQYVYIWSLLDTFFSCLLLRVLRYTLTMPILFPVMNQ